MISAFGSRMARSLSSQRDSNNSSVFVDLSLNSDRSLSRGRDLHSTGRGGVGNIRQSSTSREGGPRDGPDDLSPTRGREPHVRLQVQGDNFFSTGRGGAGNIRSPSRDVLKPDLTETADENVVRKHIVSDETAPHSTGRGGLGNISRSRSREPHSTVPGGSIHSTGRGGVGNIHPGLGLAETIDEEERKLALHDSGVHSTGRGGAANLTAAHSPAVEHHHHRTGEYESTGRGGAGNIVHG